MRSVSWLAGLSVLAVAPPAHADWQYTRWGMTPEQVVAASSGKATLLPAGQRPRMPPLETVATGEFEDAALTLRTAFSFNTDGGGLACVFYGLTGRDGADAFKALLVSRYGRPQHTSGLPAIGQETLGWVTATDEIEASFSPDDPAFAMQCAKKRRP